LLEDIVARDAELIRVVNGYDAEGVRVFRDRHTATSAHLNACEQAVTLTTGAHPVAAYVVVLDPYDCIVMHTGTAPCDRLLGLRDGQRFTVRGKVYAARTGGSEGRSYYCGDERPDHGPRGEEFRVPVWRPNGTAGHITVNAKTKIRFLFPED
jgi:hypothetical protein